MAAREPVERARTNGCGRAIMVARTNQRARAISLARTIRPVRATVCAGTSEVERARRRERAKGFARAISLAGTSPEVRVPGMG